MIPLAQMPGTSLLTDYFEFQMGRGILTDLLLWHCTGNHKILFRQVKLVGELLVTESKQHYCLHLNVHKTVNRF